MCPYTKTKTEQLVQIIGLPDVDNKQSFELKLEDFETFFKLAEKNKVHLLFLQSASRLFPENSVVKSSLSNYEERYQRTIGLTKFVAGVLKREGVSYTFFKTIKPFPYTPSDVDVLLWADDDLQTAINKLRAEGCVVLDGDLYGVTMYSPVYKLNIDLTLRVAVSGIVYADKKLLFEHVYDVHVDGQQVRTLKPSVDLLVVAGHSVYKEQMFTLSDYYACVLFSQHWKESLNLADSFHLRYALETVLKLTRNLTLNAFDKNTPISKSLNVSNQIDSSKHKKNCSELPKKYDLSTMLVGFSKKLVTDNTTFRSLPLAFLSFCNPQFYFKLLEHITREKY